MGWYLKKLALYLQQQIAGSVGKQVIRDASNPVFYSKVWYLICFAGISSQPWDVGSFIGWNNSQKAWYVSSPQAKDKSSSGFWEGLDASMLLPFSWAARQQKKNQPFVIAPPFSGPCFFSWKFILKNRRRRNLGGSPWKTVGGVNTKLRVEHRPFVGSPLAPWNIQKSMLQQSFDFQGPQVGGC